MESSLVLFIEIDFEEEYNFDFEKYDKEGISNYVKYKCNIFNEFYLIIRLCNYIRLIWFKNIFSEWENYEKEKSVGNEILFLLIRIGRKCNKWL